MPILRSGDLAYFDSNTDGLVPCRVLSIEGAEITVEYTATRPGCLRGYRDTYGLRDVVPRTAIRRQGGDTTILPYRIVHDDEVEGR